MAKTERRNISVREGRWKEWQAEAARLTGVVGRPFSISELIDNALQQYLNEATHVRPQQEAARPRAGMVGEVQVVAGELGRHQVREHPPASPSAGAQGGQGGVTRTPFPKTEQARKPKRGTA